ncbi:class I adenylate-forming enzyme family protein [Pararoseomonas indoligenes]|uniref:Acyl--CoA ligase n=1 Tax=Roseomonas indoligenes TaxID=2820811 RepID=A0A940N0P3_9PROT|nr:class I adenylate-forming enzyme family protein [Pararoseomonas indoligenes]MBP0495726.1 acyl--CoA ligase [Pararoseomonas indoligenes]
MSNTLLTTLSRERLRKGYESGFWREETIYRIAADRAARTPDAPAIRDARRRVTIGALVAAADRLSADLRTAGLRQGQRVAAWLPSRVEVAVALLACSRDGLVLCPSLHRDHTVAEVAGLLERMRAAALIAEPGHGADADRHDLFEAVKGLTTLKRVVRLEKSNGEDLWPYDGERSDAPPVPDPDGVVYLAFTSGTTGQPKGVMHSDNTLLGNARAIVADWSLGEEDVIASLSPLSHNLGFGSLVIALLCGAELVIHDLPRGKSLLDRLVETDTSYLVGVPTHAIDLLHEMRQRGMKTLGRVRGFRVSGAAVPKAVVAGLLEHGVTPQSGYGMTEASSHHYTLPNDPLERMTETSGKCCPGYEVRVFSRDNPEQELPAGETGQIGGRGASLMLGYFDEQGATEDSFNADGWFMTGDLGWVDEAGYIRITGRKKDVIIRGGHNIFPAKIETLAMQHPAVLRAAALPVPDERLGEKVCLAVQLRPGQSAEAEEILLHLDAAGLSKYDQPEYFLPVEEIPLTASGKILKRAMAARLEAGELSPRPVRLPARA